MRQDTRLFLDQDKHYLNYFLNKFINLSHWGVPVKANIYDTVMSHVSSLSALKPHILAAGI